MPLKFRPKYQFNKDAPKCKQVLCCHTYLYWSPENTVTQAPDGFTGNP